MIKALDLSLFFFYKIAVYFKNLFSQQWAAFWFERNDFNNLLVFSSYFPHPILRIWFLQLWKLQLIIHTNTDPQMQEQSVKMY